MGYFVAEEHELAEDGEGLQVLREGPQVVADEGSVERGVEDEGEDCGNGDDIVRFDRVQVLVVAGLEGSA